MRVDAGEETGANAVLVVLLVRNVFARLWIAVLLRQTEVNNIKARLGRLSGGHDEVGRFDVAVDEVA